MSPAETKGSSSASKTGTVERSKSPPTWITATPSDVSVERVSTLFGTGESVVAAMRHSLRAIRLSRYRRTRMTNTIKLTVPAGLRGAGVVALVLGGLGSRLDLRVDRIDELALAVATVAPSVDGDAFELEAEVLDDRLVVRIGPLEGGTGSDESLRRVVDALVDRVAGIRQADREWLELETFRSGAGR